MMQGFNFDQFVRNELNQANGQSNYKLDCFVSSEVAYNDVVRRCLPIADASSGAYLGVGPDQNFTYIGALHPKLAVILDARIDNTLEHLLFKLLFIEAENALDYLCLLLGRKRPDSGESAPDGASALLARFAAQPTDAEAAAACQKQVAAAFSQRWGANAELLARVERIQQEFARRQLRVTSVSEACLANLDKIPDFEEVIRATTPEGFNYHYLTCPQRFAYVKAMQQNDQIVPVLGSVPDLTALARAVQLIQQAGLRLSAVYLSNMEEFMLHRYIIADDRITDRPNPSGELKDSYKMLYDLMVDELAALPVEDNAMLIRFFFPGELAGRRLGIFPWLEAHVTPLRRFISRYRHEQPTSVLETYV